MVAVSAATSCCAWLSHGRDVSNAARAVRQAVTIETAVLAKNLSGGVDMPAWWSKAPTPAGSSVVQSWSAIEAPAPTPATSAQASPPIPSVPVAVAMAEPHPAAAAMPATPTPADVPLPIPSPVAELSSPAHVPVPPPRPMGLRGGMMARSLEASVPVAPPSPRHDVAPVAPGVRAAPPTVQAAAAAPDTRNFLEKLFGMGRAGSALGYAADEGVGGGGGTAVYDISAHTVTLPDGTRLEAHSGLGAFQDDPTHANQPMRGATPPHVYDLSLRESVFHGVQAIRLTPVGGGGIYGRTGLLAHSYMLGANGASNGCVSFRDYTAFLRAYQSGQIRRLEVVARSS